MKRLQRIFGAVAPLTLGVALATGASVAANAACQLQSPTGKIQRVVYVMFDNVHLRRDNPNVPSDLEQMPNLLNFMLDNGTITGNHSTPLISHTANDIVTALTGGYGDRRAIPVATATASSAPIRQCRIHQLVPLLDRDGRRREAGDDQ